MSSTAALSGGIGMVVVGIALAHEGFSAAGGRVLASPLVRAAGRNGRALGLGIATALAAPGTAAQPRAVVGFASGGYLRPGPALWTGVGVGASCLFTAWAVAMACQRPELHALLALMLAVCGTLAWFARRTTLGAYARTLTGWSMTLLGAAALAGGLAGTHLQLDGLALDLLPRLLLFLALGGVGAWLSGASGALIVGAGCAAAGGVLELTSAAALAAGAQAGSAATALTIARTERGDAKRVALGLGLVQVAHAPLGLLLIVLLLPLAADRPAWLAAPATALAAYQSLLWLVGLGVFAVFHKLSHDALDRYVEGDEGEGAEALGLPELAVAGLEQRVDRLAGVARSLARHVLGGGRVSDFRLGQDLEQAALLEREVLMLDQRLAIQPLPVDLAARVRAGARRAQLAHGLLADLCELRTLGAQAPGLHGTLASRLRNHELGALHLIERAVAPFGDESLDSIRDEYRVVDAHGHDMQRALLAAGASHGGLAPPVVGTFMDLVTCLERTVRRAVELAEGSVVVVPQLTGWRERLASWLSPAAPPAPEEAVEAS